MTATKSRRIAKCGEDRTAEYLEQQGYTILERNWRWGRYAEVDLIARGPGQLMVFVEVKTRSMQDEAGIPMDGFESVNLSKQRRLIKAARSYLRLVGYDTPSRFDVAVVNVHEWVADEAKISLTYVPGAFAP